MQGINLNAYGIQASAAFFSFSPENFIPSQTLSIMVESKN